MWQSGFWADGFWQSGFWADDHPDERPEDEPGIQPGAFAPLSRPSSPITRTPFKRRARRRRDQDLLIL